MKVVFTLNTLVSALIVGTIDKRKVEQACEAYRNRMAFVKDDKGNDKEKSERRLRIAGTKSSGFSAKERVTYTAERIGDLNGESNVVARFIAYNDEMTLLENRAAKIETKLAPVQIPAEFSVWLAKFDTRREVAGTVAMTPQAGVVAAKPAKNGKASAEKNRLEPATA